MFLQILENISSRKVFSSIDDSSESENAARAILKLLIDTRKLQLSERDFTGQIKLLTELSEPQLELLWNFYIKEGFINELITSGEYSFRDLEWRLEAKVMKTLIINYSRTLNCSKNIKYFIWYLITVGNDA